MEKRIFYNYTSILKNLVQYLPSRGLIILNSFFIVPFFTYALNHKEVSIYLIAIQLLNLFCTASFDWISKAVLRFYEKYRIQDKLDIFLSTVFWLSTIVYVLTAVIFIIFKDPITTKYALTNLIFGLTILLVIPCGIRQCLYQVLRLKNRYNLYTASIIFYQLLFIAGFAGLVNLIPNASAIIISMGLGILAIDLYIIRTIHEKFPIKKVFDVEILKEILQYSMPLIITNLLYYATLYMPNFIFQASGAYLKTSIFGIAFILVSNTIQPLAGLFTFVNYPVVFKEWEHKNNIKRYLTNSIQLYFCLLMPIILVFCFYAKDIVSIFLPEEYAFSAILMPYFAFKLFLHELLKLITIKYHLHQTTYVETAVSFVIVCMSVLFFLQLFNNPSLIYAVLIVLITEIVLLAANICINVKETKFLAYSRIFRTIALVLLINFMAYFGIELIFNNYQFMGIFKILVFVILNYAMSWRFRKQILN